MAGAGRDWTEAFSAQHGREVLDLLPLLCRVGPLDMASPRPLPARQPDPMLATHTAAAASAATDLVSMSLTCAPRAACRRVLLPPDVEYAARLGGRERYARVIERVLTPDECLAIIGAAEAAGFTEAMFGGAAIYDLRRRCEQPAAVAIYCCNVTVYLTVATRHCKFKCYDTVCCRCRARRTAQR